MPSSVIAFRRVSLCCSQGISMALPVLLPPGVGILPVGGATLAS